MGKLKLTFISLLFFIIIFLSCFLAENFAFYSATQLDGLNRSSTLLIAALIILLLIIYYFVEHKKNGMKFDKILLPIVLVCSLLLILVVLWQGPTTIKTTDGADVVVQFSALDKTIIILQIVIWMAVLYAILFVNNRYNVIKKVAYIFTVTYFFFMLVCAVSDVFYEWPHLIDIANGTYEKSGFGFIIYNSNVWGMMLLIGQLTCYMLSKKKFNLFCYLVSIFFFISNVFSTCTTTVFIGGALLIIHTVFEILTLFKRGQKKKGIISSACFFGIIALMAILFTILYQSRVMGFVNLWDYIVGDIFLKDYVSLTQRTEIWKDAFKLITSNPIAFIFGLGFKTSNVYLKTVGGFRSTHNGYIEVFLRHGLLGLLVYVGALALFVYSLVKVIKKKQYRFAFIYGLCFIATLVHAVAESTVFFTPNIQGCFLTLGIYLPVVNVLQEKHFAALKEETNIEEVVSEHKGMGLPYLVSIILGLGMALIIASGTCLDKRLNEAKVFIIIGAAIIGGVIVLSFVPFIKKPKRWFNDCLIPTLRASFFPMMVTVTLGVLVVNFVNAYYLINLFCTIVIMSGIFMTYVFMHFLINRTYEELNSSYNRLLFRLYNRTYE